MKLYFHWISCDYVTITMVTVEFEEEQRPRRLPRSTSFKTAKQKLDAAVARARRPKSCGSIEAAMDLPSAEWTFRDSGESGDLHSPTSAVPSSYPRPFPLGASPFAATLSILRHSLRRRLSHTAGPKRRPRRRYSRHSNTSGDLGSGESTSNVSTISLSPKQLTFTVCLPTKHP